ncbi:hypothetical protein QBC44DRAFT_346703 [Cladorrhinum sp. PSN332]|nr:hypothetical protein QBC44DRAFT_346703 [Cladorrhinum sp. PSN332]
MAENGIIQASIDKKEMTHNLWGEALQRLRRDDREEVESISSSGQDMLGTLKQAIESEKQCCIDKGWAVYKSEGKEIKLRYVLEKISVWVNEIIPIVDQAVRFDASGNAAMPWAIVKLLVTGVSSNITVFTALGDGVESVTRLLVRCALIEKLYLGESLEITEELCNALTQLYAAVLVYLAAAKRYFEGNISKKIGRGLLDTMAKRYEALQNDISEDELEKLLRIADAELRQRMETETANRYEDLQQRLERLDQPIMSMAIDVSVIRDHFDREERLKVLEWMSTIPFSDHHEMKFKDLIPGSGEWLLKSREFTGWSQSNESSVLWLVGMMGSGKSSLVAKVIDSLSISGLTNEPCRTAYFFCSRSTAEPERAIPVSILSTLVKQLGSASPDQPIRLPIAEEYAKRKEKSEPSAPKKLNISDCTRLILEMSKSSPAFIIIDALDELIDHSDEESNTQHLNELLRAVDTIVSQSKKTVKVFLSSRENINLPLYMPTTKSAIIRTHITADRNGEDIGSFIESEVNKLATDNIFLHGNLKPDLRESMIRKLKAGSNGMFQWVSMSLETLKSCKTSKDLKTKLGRLPRKLFKLYDSIYKEITIPKSHAGEVAEMVFTLLLYARRLLSPEELLAAVSAHLDEEEDDELSSDSGTDSSSDMDYFSVTAPEILDICRNLIGFDPNQNAFRLPHLSVREYLISREEYSPLQAHSRILGRRIRASSGLRQRRRRVYRVSHTSPVFVL